MSFVPPSTAGAPLAPLIDHTLLKPTATADEVVRLCAEARFYGFAAVCVSPARLEQAVAELRGSPVRKATVIAFPCGTATAAAAAFEAGDAVGLGADELDMVIALGLLKDGQPAAVTGIIRGVVAAAAGRPVKVILETHLLTQAEKVTACRLAVDAGAAFVKTSTGFSGGGATVDDIRLMRATVGPVIGVKASGGVRTLEEARRMVEAGATRIGTSSGVAIVTAAPPAAGFAAY